LLDLPQDPGRWRLCDQPGGDAASLKVRGRKHIAIYHARLKNEGDKRAHSSTAERHFCSLCGSGLWLFSPEWPELIHPFASAIDTPLPVPPEHTHLMLGSKASWVEVEAHGKDRQFDVYPEESIAQWHERLGLGCRDPGTQRDPL
jgi:hypothetical protein